MIQIKYEKAIYPFCLQVSNMDGHGIFIKNGKKIVK